MFPYIGGQIPQPRNPVESAAAGFNMTQQAIANQLKMEQQRELNKVYPQMLQDQLNLAGAQLAEQQIKTQYAPQTAKANYAKLLAETEKSRRINETDSGVTTGIAGQLLAYNDAIERGDPNANLILEGIKKGSASNIPFRAWPMDVKRSTIAQGVAFGLDQAYVADRLFHGATLQELAAESGINPEEMASYTPIFNPTQPSITAAQKRIAAEAEMQYLTPIVTEWMEPYIDPIKIGSYSPTQMMDAIKGENPDQQAKFFAATALLPEINYLRLRLAGGETAISSLLHIEERVVGNYQAFEKFMTPEVFSKTQELINESLYEAANVSNEAIFNPIAHHQKIERVKKEKTLEEDPLSDDPLGIR